LRRSTKCIFDFDPDTLEARLAFTFPGVAVDDVKANTGFEVKNAKKVEVVPPPTKEELEALRTEVDKTGVLRH
jgi:glutaconate CoA-transferase subunit B